MASTLAYYNKQIKTHKTLIASLKKTIENGQKLVASTKEGSVKDALKRTIDRNKSYLNQAQERLKKYEERKINLKRK